MPFAQVTSVELPPAAWQRSVVGDQEVMLLEKVRLLLAQAMVRWHPDSDEMFPTTHSDEFVVFASFFERGFSLPVSSFFWGLLDFYKLELHHLNPNFILQIYLFVYICEAFLGIPPHFNLFCHLFMVKPHPAKTLRGWGCQDPTARGVQEGDAVFYSSFPSIDATPQIGALMDLRLYAFGADIPTQTEDFPHPFNASFKHPVDRHQYLSHPPGRIMPKRKRVAEASTDESAAKKSAGNPDVELEVPGLQEEIDEPVTSQPPLPPWPFELMKQFLFQQGTQFHPLLYTKSGSPLLCLGRSGSRRSFRYTTIARPYSITPTLAWAWDKTPGVTERSLKEIHRDIPRLTESDFVPNPSPFTQRIQAHSDTKSQALRLLSPWITTLMEIEKDRAKVIARAKAVDNRQRKEIEAMSPRQNGALELGPSAPLVEEVLQGLCKVPLCFREVGRDSVKADTCQAFVIMKSLYPRVDFAAATKGFASTMTRRRP
uniref:Transposase (putative) gypsy type domain-containing protein n=1 Tax=Oryza brachyantha TaxID=4533 RepID=J3NCS5_ORYBR